MFRSQKPFVLGLPGLHPQSPKMCHGDEVMEVEVLLMLGLHSGGVIAPLLQLLNE